MYGFNGLNENIKFDICIEALGYGIIELRKKNNIYINVNKINYVLKFYFKIGLFTRKYKLQDNQYTLMISVGYYTTYFIFYYNTHYKLHNAICI